MKKYIAMQMEVIDFSKEDVIRTSGVGGFTVPGDEVIGDPFEEANFGA